MSTAGQDSPHFRASEFACPHCGVTLVRPALQACLERLRGHVDKPVRIVSGYRCPVHNTAIGGAANSQHMYGAAADIPIGTARPMQARHAGFSGIGISRGWAIHVDVRDGKPQSWFE